MTEQMQERASLRHPDLNSAREGDWYVAYIHGRGWVVHIQAKGFHQVERHFRTQDDALEWVENHVDASERVRIIQPGNPDVILSGMERNTP